MNEPDERLYTVGELARRCGITVRTLQFYDGSGLLSPGRHSEGGRRLYGKADIFRLQQILFLKSFGFSLEDIRTKLLAIGDSREFIGVLREQKNTIGGQIASLRRAVDTIGLAIRQLEYSGNVPVELLFEILDLLRHSTYVLKYFRSDEVERLLQSTDAGNEKAQQAIGWLTRELMQLHRDGVDPRGPRGVDFAKRWMNAVDELTGGDPEMMQSALSAGADVDNWPDDLGDFKKAIQGFLAPAMAAWMQSKGLEKEDGNG